MGIPVVTLVGHAGGPLGFFLLVAQLACIVSL
ncbi:hypothetical protein ES703_14667 [subsurface metagenome]